MKTHLFRLLAVLLALSITLGGLVSHAQEELPATLPNGVAAGDVTQTSAVLWAHSTAPGTIVFEYNQDMLDGSFRELGSVEAEVTDPTVPVKVVIEGLEPGGHYFYNVTDAAGGEASGHFRTPAAVGTRQGLRFGVSGDWRGELSPYPAISNAAGRDLDFFVAHGDTIYADFPSPDLPGPQALTLEEYRIKHNEVYGTRDGMNTFAALRESTALFATIDDHEVTNDFAGGAPPSSDIRFEDDPSSLINETVLYNNGLQVFQEYNPLRDEFYGETGDPRTAGKRKLYRYVTFGSDAAIFLLDSRSFRDTPLANVEDFTNRMAALSFLGQSFDPKRTMLGQAQLEELKSDLVEAQGAGITWKLILNPEPIQNFGLVNASDRFEGYAYERNDLLRFIDEQGITNVVFITADFHGTVINDLGYQANPLAAPTPIASFEVITGAVAFDAPFGPTVVDLAAGLGFLTDEQVAAYNAMSLVEKDGFIEQMVNAQVEPLGYSFAGLQDSTLLNTELLQGSYVVAHTYGWTEFEIEADTQQLRVTTYGIPYYSQADLEADPAEIVSRTPAVVSEFVVTPQ